MKMRESRVLNRLREGRPVFSLKVNTKDTRVVEMMAMHGVECIWTCAEHVANDWGVIESQILAAKAYDADTVVRVPRGSYSDYIRPLELDAAGIMVPHIMSAEDARRVAEMTRFYPIGKRPVDGGNADGRYCAIPAAEYNEQANRNRFVIVQIEDPEAVEELDGICEVPGIDMVFFGPGDYSHRLGVSGQLDHPEVCRVRELVARKAREHGIYAGTVAGPATADEYLRMGYQFLNLGSDVAAMLQYMTGIREFLDRHR
ncbi:MAG: aldolase/citrate lyase family protein [Eubacteriales bacterium]|nr:aldolase/citrate lyase family protein [Clostridiales bacterium]MDY3070672.1 aldolase/citrate lyase family protein [Eubacteriales bacterium]